MVPMANDYIKNQTKSNTFYEGSGWFGELVTLEPMDGFMLKSGHSGTLTYPAGEPIKGISSGNSDNLQLRPDKGLKPENYEFSGQITASVKLDGKSFDSNEYCLFSIVDGQIRGVSRGMLFEPTRQYVYNHLTYSNFSEGDTIRFRLYDAVTDNWYAFEESVVFNADMLIANAFEPFKLERSHLLESSVSLSSSIEIWPNPMSSLATIQFTISTDQPVLIEVMDYSGRIMDELELGIKKAGQYVTEWDTRKQPPGVYFIRLKNAPSVYKKVIISR